MGDGLLLFAGAIDTGSALYACVMEGASVGATVGATMAGSILAGAPDGASDSATDAE